MADKLPAPEPDRGSAVVPAEGSGVSRAEVLRPVAAEDGEGLTPRRVALAILRHKWLVLLVAAAGTGMGFAGITYINPTYSAQATVWIESPGSSQATPGLPIQTGALLGSQAWLDLLRSYAVLEYAVRTNRLYLRPAEAADTSVFSGFDVEATVRPGEYRLVVDETGTGYRLETAGGEILERGVVGDAVGRGLGFLWQPRPGTFRAGRRVAFTVLSPRDEARRLSRDLRTRIDGSGNFLRIELTGTDPARITAMVNGVTERFVELGAELKRERVAELESILDAQLQQAGQYLSSAEIALENFRVETITLPSDAATPAPGLDMTRGSVFGRFFDMKYQLEQLRHDRRALEQVLAQVRDGAEVPVLALEMIGPVVASSELTQVLGQLSNLRVELRTLRREFTDQHPTVRGVLQQIEMLERHTVPMLLESAVRQIAAREAELGALVDVAAAEMRDIPPRMSEEARLVRHVSTADELYTMLRRRYEEARLAAATAIPDMRVLDWAVESRWPVHDRRRQLLLLMVMGTLGLALVGAVVLDRIDPRLHYPEQVSDLGIATLGTVPHVRSARRRPAWPAGEDAALVDAFRVIRLNLTHAYGTAGPMLVTVSSPGEGDGKSFVSVHLALAFAMSGQKTLLIDGDIRRGALHETLDYRREPGLTEFLTGETGWDDIVRPTPNPMLSLVTTGTRRKNGPELLGRPAMGELYSGALRADYGVILVDTPPLSAGVDPYLMATWTRSLLLVMRTGNTNRQMAGLKLEVVGRLPIRLLGAVLNDVPSRGVYRYYAYDAGYALAEAYDADAGRQLPG